MKEILTVLVLAAVVLLPFAGVRDLFDADEGRYAAVALDMVRSGNWVVPHLDGMPFMDKPPLVYHVQAVLTEAFGSAELVARSPTLLAGIIWVLFVFLFARDWTRSRRAAWLAAALAATSAAGIIGSRVGPQMDMPLAACVAGALYAAWRGVVRPGILPSLGLGLAVGLGLLTKGPLVAAVPFLVAVAWALCGVPVTRLARVAFSPWAWGLALLVAAPWYVLVERAQPGWIEHFITYEHFGRFGQGDHRNFHPFWFYVPITLLYLVPWTPMAWRRSGPGVLSTVSAIVTGSPWFPRPWRRALDRTAPIGRQGREVGVSTLAWTFFLAAFLLYSASTRKLLNYLLPAALPLFVLAGARFDQLLSQRKNLPSVLPGLLGVGTIAGGILIYAGAFFPLSTGAPPTGEEVGRWTALGPWWIGAGAALLLFTIVSVRRRDAPAVRVTALVIGAMLFWWGLDLGFARVDELGSARSIAERLALDVQEGRLPVALKRYPQGIRFYADVDVRIAGGTPERWLQREIVNPYARRAWEEGQGLLTTKQIEALWESERPLALVVRRKEIALLGARVLAGPFAGAGRTDLFVVTNQPLEGALEEPAGGSGESGESEEQER